MTAGLLTKNRRSFSADEVRLDFPILATHVHGKPLIYLDNAATTQKPTAVIDAIEAYYRSTNSNIHRAVHHLSAQATEQYDAAREKVRAFINASSPAEVIFVRGTTEAINLVASSYGGKAVGPGDTVLVSAMEHHSNIVPWQMLVERVGANLRVIPMDNDGVLDMAAAEQLLADRPRILSVVQVSNALGTVNPVKELIEIAHNHGVPVMVDGAQAVQHRPVDVTELKADFYAFSGHKIYGPTGIGVLYGRRELLESMPPYQGGGDMISSVTFEKSTWSEIPSKFEAGTPDIAGAIGLGAALDYLSRFDIEEVAAHEQDLLSYATEQLSSMELVRIIGNSKDKAGAISFVVDGVHPHDIGTFLDHDGVAIRTGHHCAQPVMDFFEVPATARLSFGMYNTRSDVDAFADSLHRTIKVLS